MSSSSKNHEVQGPSFVLTTSPGNSRGSLFYPLLDLKFEYELVMTIVGVQISDQSSSNTG